MNKGYTISIKGLQKTIPKCAKTMKIKGLHVFFVGIKTPYYAPKRNKMSLIRCVPHGKTLRTGLFLID
jgi:hypothetical protein